MKRWICFLIVICITSLLYGSTYIKNTYDDNVVDAGVTDTLTHENQQTTRLPYDIAPYSGKAYVDINGGQPDFSDDDKQITEAFEFYSELDSLGRCGAAYANICPEIMPTEDRAGIGQIKPSGWHIVKYNDLIDGNYLYNRCHLIGYQLAGENANEKNLITGTRYLNVDGMLPFENMINDYVRSTEHHVLYRVTPIFEGSNLVASGVEMEAWSVEDEGNGICFHVYCYNVQPGIEINYTNGESNIIEMPSGETEGTDYVLNMNTRRIHLPTCSSVNDMAEHNKKKYTGNISDLKSRGYVPCGNCLSEYRD